MKQMLVHCASDLTAMALIENNKLVEYTVEYAQRQGVVGSFFKGKVVNVVPGMQAAFVDIGQKKNAFLYIDDILPQNLDQFPKEKPAIQDLVKTGQELVVQVTKDAFGNKGARITTHYSLPGRWLVYMPFAGYVAISKKIKQEEERERLKIVGEELRQEEEGLILRTVAEQQSLVSIEQDFRYLQEQWKSILKRAQKVAAPAALHHDLSMVQRLIRDAYSPETDNIIVDCPKVAEEVSSFVSSILPNEKPHVNVYKGTTPLLEQYLITPQVERDFGRKTWLPGGGYLIWDHTEALTVIDVNTGKYTGGQDLEDTVYHTNLEAAAEMARLIRLRDIAGIIIIDFIDMDSEAHRDAVLGTLGNAMAQDRTQHHILGWTRLGLVEMTRKRMREITIG